MSTKAFPNFKKIDSLSTFEEKHREWLKDYEGKKYGKGFDGRMVKGFKWTETSYRDELFEKDINYVGRLGNRLVIEFDGDSDKAKEFLNETEEKLKKFKFGYIRSTHSGKSDYLWVEFTRNIKAKEAEKFLYWVAPKTSEVDLNFASLRKIFPVLFAMHGKHSHNFEKPVRYVEGKKIDIDSIGISFMEAPLKKNVQGYITAIKSESQILTRRGQLEHFWESQPFYYDESKIFWIWDKENKKWSLSDEINFLNSIRESLGIETIDSKTRNELIEGFKQVGRKHKPEPMKKSWVQFKDKIYDVKTEEEFEATPKYFVTNPIPWNLGKSDKTPIIDKLFSEWVGEDHKQELYEIIANTMSLDTFMQRIFAFCGGGSNGKGTFIKLLYKFLGEDNCTTSEMKSLSENRFEPAVLFRKLLCVMGEVSHDDLRNTNQIKKIAGEDKISFEFKGKNPFSEENTATCICLTNSLSITPDKSVGFYRKWFIEDFPNQFTGINKDLISNIPDKEFENLALRCLNELKTLYKTKKFTNEGSFDERMKKYEERSNPVMKFVDEFCTEDLGFNLVLRKFTNACNDYLRLKHLRVLTANQIGKILRDEGFTVGNRNIDGISSVVILNLKLLELSKLSKSKIDIHKEMNEKKDSSDISNSFSKGNDKFYVLKSTNLTVLKDKEPFNLTLEEGKEYLKSYLGDDSNSIIKMLEEDLFIK